MIYLIVLYVFSINNEAGLTLEMYMAAKTKFNWGIFRVFWGCLGYIAEYGFILECIMHITFFYDKLVCS